MNKIRSLRGGIMKSEEITRRQFADRGQSWFSKKYACWANNHNGWSKMKNQKKKYEDMLDNIIG